MQSQLCQLSPPCSTHLALIATADRKRGPHTRLELCQSTWTLLLGDTDQLLQIQSSRHESGRVLRDLLVVDQLVQT